MAVGQLDQVDDRGSHKQVDIASKIENLEDQFDSLQTRIINELSTKSGLTVQKLLDQLTRLPLSLRTEYESSIVKRIPSMRTETKVNELFIHLNPLTSFIDYGLIEYFIKKFGSDSLKRDMRSYCSVMVVFMKETTVRQLIDHLPGQAEVPPKFSLIEAKIGENASECTLEQLNTIRKRYCSELRLSVIIFHLLALLDSNSFIVRWLLSSAFVEDIMKSARTIDQNFYQKCKITSLTLDGMWLFLSESEIDAIWSQINMTDAIFKTQFHTIYNQVMYELEIQGVSEHKLLRAIMDQELNKPLLTGDSSLPLMIFEMLTVIVEEFGSDCLKRVMKSYCNYVMSIDTKHLTAQQLIALSPLPSKPSKYFVIGECRIVEKASEYGLERLASFQTRFCTMANINRLGFVIGEISMEMSNSFTVRWLAPSALVSDILESTRNVNLSFFHECKLSSLTLDGMWLFMSKTEIDAMWSQMQVSHTQFIDQFCTMCKQIMYEMKLQNVSEDRLSLYLQSLNYQQQISNQLSLALLEAEFPASFVDFGVLKAVIEGFGSDCLKKVMGSYCNYMSIFTKESTVQQLVNLSAPQSEHKHFVAAKCTIMEEPSHYRLEKLLQIRTRFCAIASFNEVCFVMDEVNMEMSSSFTVSWLVPSDLVSDVIAKSARYVDQSFYQEYKITSFTLDGMWLFLSETEIDGMWSKMSGTRFGNQFQAMYKQIVCELGEGKKSGQELSQYLMIGPHLKLEQDLSIYFSEALLKQDFPLSLIDFEVLTIIIDRFGSNCLKGVMKSCINYIISVYSKRSSAQELIGLTLIPSEHSKYFTIAECRILKEPSEYRLRHLFSFQTRFCNVIKIDKVCFVFGELKAGVSGSFTVSWLVPSCMVCELQKSANQIKEMKWLLFQKFYVASLQLGSGWLYHCQITPFGAKLKKQYQLSEGAPSPVEWIPPPTMKIFRLAMIQRERVQRGHIEDRFVQMTISGRVDDILHTKSPVELEDIFRRALDESEIILIEGAPGSGKSTLTVHICQRWGKGELFQQFTVVILVQLRDPAVQRAQTIADLLPVENAEEIAAELIATNGRGVLWVLDGWDELPPHLQQESVFRELIERMLNECSVIVTSRPISSGDLHPVVSSRIEVLGFTPEEQRQYFTECLKEDTKALEVLLEKIQENPVVQSICYLPLNAAFIVHTFKYRDQSLPNTEYEIYLSVILSCIQRHYDREGRGHVLPRELASLDDLSRSEAVREPFQCLCELAYHGVMENKVTFSSSDLPQGSNTLSLLQAIESFLQSGKSVFYNFLHLSVQEVLSAYYITTRLSDSEQVSQFQRLFNQPRFAAVFQFYAAITKLKSPGIRQVIDRIVEAKSKRLLVSLLRCLHEAQDPDLCLYVAERLEYELDLSGTSLSPLDCLSVSFFLSFDTGKEVGANLTQCQIGDLGAKNLTKYLSMSSHTDLVIINLKGNDIHDESASYVAKTLYFIENLHLDISENPIGDAGASLILEALQISSTLKSLTLVGYAVFSTRIEDILFALGQNNFLKKFDVFWNNPADKEITQPSLDLKASVDKDIKLSALNFTNLHKIMKDMPKLSLNSTTGVSASEELNSFVFNWCIPSVPISYLMESAKQIEMGYFEMKDILSLSVGNLWLYNPKLNPFGSILKQQYQQFQSSPSPVEWIPSPSKKIFRLAMIQRERLQQGYNIKNIFLPESRVGDAPLVELEHIFTNTLHGGEIILIEGAPGSGKSTLTVHICQRWGKGELFQQFTIVILVQLGDPAVQRAQTIADLLLVENAEEIATELIGTNGRGVLWVLDGWDELPPHLQQQSIFFQLIKRMLSECSVIVTSRPISSGDIRPKISSRIEVLGFTPEEQRQYFTECLKGDTKALEVLLEKMQENPLVQSICYLPLNAAFIVHTFKYKDQSLPNTEYEIYLSFILSCIQRHYDREGRGHDLPRKLASLDDLSRSEAVREPFQCLCELAYRGVMDNKVTFSSSDLPQGSNTLSLLQAIESFLQSGKSVFYNFLHLSVQEVLSAYYINAKLSDSEQVSQFQPLFDQPRFAAVFQFYAAITKLKSPGIRQVIDRIVEAKSKPLLVSLLRCLHEAQDPAFCLYVAERLEYRLDLKDTSLSPLDCLSVSFFLSSLTGKGFAINLSQCFIGDIGAKCLTKFLAHYASEITIDLYNCKLNQKDASYIATILYFIEHVYLTYNPIGDTGASLISEVVRETATLKTLILYNCGITSRGAEDLSRALAQNSSLEKLDIGWNYLVGDDGISHVAEALKQNKQLKELWISQCGMTDKGAASLASALTVNNSLKMLHMGGGEGKLTGNGLSTIAQSLANHSLLVKLAIPESFGSTTADHLNQEINEARRKNGLPPVEIEGEYTVCCIALFPGFPSPFLTFFVREYYSQKIEGEGEPGTKPHPPVAFTTYGSHGHGGHALHCAHYRSHAALWIVATSSRSYKDSKL